MPIANDLARIGTNDAVRFLNSHRVFFYSLVSFISVFAVITNALKNYSNLYSVSIYLSKSSRSVLVLANFGVLVALLCGHIVQRIFFGALRPNEVERLYDRLWFFITESLLAFTIFRDEFDVSFALMFGFLLFVKSFHWLASDRIEWMDQRPYPGPPLLFHFRMNILFVMLWATDLVMFLFAVEHTLSVGVGGMVLFASEYGILLASIINTLLKYLLSTYDLRRAGRMGGDNAPPWENKSMWTFYIELTTDFLKLTTYLVFFIIIITYYGLPLNIIRDVYITARSFITRLRALHRYRTATRNMDQRYPNATEAELTAMSDRTCIICREEMVLTGAHDQPAPAPAQADGPNTTPKKLPCGHIFHFHCLRSWLERQQSCPTCRRNVLEETNTGPQTAAMPVPGQRPNAPGDPQPANQQPQQGGNNPLGLIGRFFGPPARLANPAPPNRQPIANNQAQVGGQQPGIFINYHVQYQIPRRQNGENLAPVQAVPVPPYPGFQAPGGAWQPWPGEDEAAQPQAPAEAPILIQTSASSEDSSPSINNDAVPNPQPASPDSRQGSSTPNDSLAGGQTPREAAAQAALRRLGSQNGVPSRPRESVASTTGIDAMKSLSPTPTEKAQSPTPARPSVDTQAPTSSTAVPMPTPSQMPAVPQSASSVPQLIPLLDFTAPTRPPLPRETSALHNQQHHLLRSFQNHVMNQAMPSPRLPQSSSSFSSISSQLPTSLTDEQLATLDTLTREGIDERLRVLEGVSRSVYGCIDDLMRLRSALPAADTSTPATRASPPPPATAMTSNEGEATSVKGKEKETSTGTSASETSIGEQSSNSSTEQLVDL